jgi:hypothetical protein
VYFDGKARNPARRHPLARNGRGVRGALLRAAARHRFFLGGNQKLDPLRLSEAGPQKLDRVRGELPIRGNEAKSVELSLSHKDAIERISVVRRPAASLVVLERVVHVFG